MVIRIVTDSGADLSEDILKELSISVVPLHILFGSKDFRDGVDIKHEDLYKKLVEGPTIPTTSTASPGEFAAVFHDLIKGGADGIVCISLSEKLSKTYGSAVQAQKMFEESKCPITVINSEGVAMGMGFLAMLAARLAKEGKSQAEIVSTVQENIPRIHLIGALETLKYLIKGGRAPKLAVVSDILKLKTFIKIHEGEVRVIGRTRTQREKINQLMGFIEGFANAQIEEIAVEYAGNREEAETLLQEIALKFPKARTYFSIFGAAIGVHSGPGIIAISLRTKN